MDKMTEKMPKKEMYIGSDEIIVINGKKYIPSSRTKMKEIDGIKHVDRYPLVEFDEKDFNKKINHIAKVLSKKLDKEEIIEELIKKKPFEEINKLYTLFTMSKIKSLKVQKGCIGIKVNSGYKKTGGAYFQLID